MKVDYTFSNPGSIRNEDSFWLNDKYLVLLDGSTSLKDAVFTAADFVTGFIKYFEELINSGFNMIDSINRTIELLFENYKQAEIDPSNIYPSAAGIIAHVNKDSIDVISIGDCSLKFFYKDGTSKLIRKNDVARFDNKVLERLVELRNSTGRNIRDLLGDTDIKNMLINNRQQMNALEGYRIFSFNMQYPITEDEIVTYPLAGISCLYMFTDGFDDVEEMFTGAIDEDPAIICDALRKMETDDPEYNKYPRFKMGDDATVIRVSFE